MLKTTMLVPNLRDGLNSEFNLAKLPPIRGKWLHVDPYKGSSTAGGESFEDAVDSIAVAYDLCTSGDGDGIIVYAGGDAADETTSYLKQSITWSKHGITVIGVGAPTGLYNRARIEDLLVETGTIATISMTATTNIISRSTGSFLTNGFEEGQAIYIYSASDHTNDGVTTIVSVSATEMEVAASLTTKSAATLGNTYIKSYAQNILVSGNNNVFYNLMIYNGGALSYSLGGVVVTGARNYFGRCHIMGGMGCTATAYERSLELGTGAQENVFEDCTIGSDTVDRGNNANCELAINGTTAETARNYFKNCLFLAMSSTAGGAHLAIKSDSATSMGRNMYMDNCVFDCYCPNKGAGQASLFGGTEFNTATIVLNNPCVHLKGYAAIDAAGSTNVYTNYPQANAVGGLTTAC